MEVARQIIKSMSVFRTLWFEIMLVQADMWLSSGFIRGASIWMGHLKDRYMELASQCLVFSSTDSLRYPPASLTPTGFTICLHFLKATVAATIAIDSRVGNPAAFPDQKTQEMLDLISNLSDDPQTRKWRELQDIYILGGTAVLRHKRHVHEGNLLSANTALKEFLFNAKVTRAQSLEAKCFRIDIAIKYGEERHAIELLSTIDNHDTTDQLYTLFGDSPVMELQRYIDRRKLDSLELIFIACVKAKDWKRAKQLMGLLDEASPGYFTSVGSYTHLWPWQRCLYAGLVHEKEEAYNLAMQYFLQSWMFVIFYRDAHPEQESRRELWELSEVNLLFGCLVHRALRWQRDQPTVTKLEATNDPRFDPDIFRMFAWEVDYTANPRHHFDDAVLFLESSKVEYIWKNKAQPGSVKFRYKYQAWVELRAKKNLTAEEDMEMRLLEQEKDDWNSHIWGGQGENMCDKVHFREKFFPHTERELYGAIPQDAIVIYTGLSERGLAIMAIDHTGVIVASYNETATPSVVKTLVLTYLDALLDREAKDGEQLKACLEFTGATLSNLLVRPFEVCIDKRNHVCFVLSGDLLRIPVGALLYRGNYLGLQRQVTHVPSLTALRHLRRWRAGESSSHRQLRNTVIARPGGLADQIETGMKPLPMAGIEAMLLANMMGTSPLNAKTVDTAQFQDLLRDSEFLHICTHGQTDPNYAFNSVIHLKDRFRVLDMLAVRTEVSLVVFSACLSSRGHTSDSGDIQGFSHALLAAGANAYIGALWEVNDVATMIHMYLFYLTLLVLLDTPTLAEAWHNATKILYGLSTEETIKILSNFIEGWDKWEERGQNPNQFVKNGRKKLVIAIESLRTEEGAKAMDLKHPYFWAGFTLVGNGSLMVKSSGYEMLKHAFQGVDLKMKKTEGEQSKTDSNNY